jgi:hypothetical protein
MRASLFLVCAAMVFATPAAAQNLVNNGGFETGDFSGFTQFGNTGFTGVTSGAASQGSFGAEFGPVGSTGGISQNLTTIAGESYLISFDLRNNGGTPNLFEVLFGSSQLFTATDSAPFSFTNFSTTAVATGSTTALSFSFRQDPDYFNLDNISVTRVAPGVPEPGTWAMMLIGFGAVGSAMRRRRPLMITQAA